jgi:hypothetical protein
MHLFYKYHGSRPLVRPRHKYENNTEMDLKEVCVFNGRN